MTTKYIVHGGLIRPVVSVAESRTEGELTVDVRSGSTFQRSKSRGSPGPGWRADPQRKGGWVKATPRMERMTVRASELRESEGWPVGIAAHGQSLEVAAGIILPIMRRAVEAGKAMARRVQPKIHRDVIRGEFERSGLAMPDDSEEAALLSAAWESVVRPPKRRAGRNIIMEAIRARQIEQVQAAARAEDGQPLDLTPEPEPEDEEPGPEDDIEDEEPGPEDGPVDHADGIVPDQDSDALHGGDSQDDGGDPVEDGLGEQRDGPTPEELAAAALSGADRVEPAAARAETAQAPPLAQQATSTGDAPADTGVQVLAQGVQTLQVPAGHFYSEPLKRVLPDDDHHQLLSSAAGAGWPHHYFEGAERRKKGAAGYTLVYMASNPYNADKHKAG